MNKTISQIQREVWENTATFKTAHIVAVIMLSIVIAITFYSFTKIDPNLFDVNTEAGKPKLSWHYDNEKKAEQAQAHTTDSASSQEKSEAVINPTTIFTDPDRIQTTLTVAASLFSLLAITLSLQYANGALINDRKDNSILFFKSMPVSETQVVVTRLGMGVFGVLLAAILAMLCTWVIYIIAASVFGYFYADLGFFHLWQSINPVILFTIISLEMLLAGLWILPVIAWIFLVGSWASKNVAGTAFLPLVLVYMIEKWFFETNYVPMTVIEFVTGFNIIESSSETTIASQIVEFFTRSGLWLGLILTIVCISSAIYLRNRRFEI